MGVGPAHACTEGPLTCWKSLRGQLSQPPTRPSRHTHARAPRSPGILSLECRLLPGSSGLRRALSPTPAAGTLAVSLGDCQCGSRVVSPADARGPRLITINVRLFSPKPPPVGTVPRALEHFQAPQGHLKPKKKITTEYRCCKCKLMKV